MAQFQIAVELGLLVQLDRNHHAVGHALGAHVVIVPVGHINQGAVGIRSRVECDGLRLCVAVEELLVGGVNPGADLVLRVAVFSEQVAVFAGDVRPGAVDIRILGLCRR